MWSPPSDHPLRRMFAGFAEQTFLHQLGVGDPPLIDYLSELLSKFIHMDSFYRLRNGQGKRLEEVADMMMEAETLPAEGRTRREVHRHIGDVTLFWTGVYPEALDRLRSALGKDHFIDYCEQGKRSYYIASTFEDETVPRGSAGLAAAERRVRVVRLRVEPGAARMGTRPTGSRSSIEPPVAELKGIEEPRPLGSVSRSLTVAAPSHLSPDRIFFHQHVAHRFHAQSPIGLLCAAGCRARHRGECR